MIRRLSVKNFKSIRDASLDLERLTVVIGANGSGKSNLIKAVEFLAAVAADDLADAVRKHGGPSGLLPKALGNGELHSSKLGFSYQVILPPLAGQKASDGLPLAPVDHSFNVIFPKSGGPRLSRGELTFHDVIAVSRILTEKDRDAIEAGESTKLTIRRSPDGFLKLSAKPAISGRTIADYLSWFGMDPAHGNVKNKEQIEDTLRNLLKARAAGFQAGDATVNDKNLRHLSMIGPWMAPAFSFCPQYMTFRSMLSTIKRYDLLLNELRAEQSVDDSRELASSGRNLPSVLEGFLGDSANSDDWRRLLATFSEIAPHILSMQTASLRTGKQFVEFMEASTKRGVESWESSDGSLRALAILLGLESHPPGGVFLIEEPELNLHPWAVRCLMEHIQETVTQRNLQVVMTSHSQQVLECVKPEQVLVATRSHDEGTKFLTLQEILPGHKIAMGEVGNLWVKGLLGGVPGAE
ncbi:MAG: AAA family ATPase [bacterium]|nr:AAA family ATPase [bacterium]